MCIQFICTALEVQITVYIITRLETKNMFVLYIREGKESKIYISINYVKVTKPLFTKNHEKFK